MNQTSLDEDYLRWLYELVGDPDHSSKSRTYWKLIRQLYTTEFIWFIPNDDNRCADGLDVRREFCEALKLRDVDSEWMGLGCSMLELLVGLSRRLSFMADGEPSGWFWIMIDNLQLRFNDRVRYPEAFVEEVLNNVIWRGYEPDGLGGLFPLQHADRDQRDVELWYQLNEYVLEHS